MLPDSTVLMSFASVYRLFIGGRYITRDTLSHILENYIAGLHNTVELKWLEHRWDHEN